jgi:hypothetical protein
MTSSVPHQIFCRKNIFYREGLRYPGAIPGKARGRLGAFKGDRRRRCSISRKMAA